MFILYTLLQNKGHFPLGGIFRAERHFLLLEDQLAESGRKKTKENIIQHGEFRLVENIPKRLRWCGAPPPPSKIFKLLKYKHIIYSFQASDLEISNM